MFSSPSLFVRSRGRRAVRTHRRRAPLAGGRSRRNWSLCRCSSKIDVNDRLSLEQAVVENLHRVDLHPLEEAAAYQQLIDEFDLTHEQVAQRVGKSRANITNTLRLLQLGEAAQSALAKSQITAGHARSLLAITDPNAQATMVARVIKNELSVRATEEAVKSFLEPSRRERRPAAQPDDRSPAASAGPDASVAELEHLLEDYLDTRVHVDLKGRNGRIIIDFADLDDLERIYIAISQAEVSLQP